MIIDSALKKSPMTQLTEFSDSIARMPPKAWQWRSYVNDPFLSTINNSTHPISNIYIYIYIHIYIYIYIHIHKYIYQ